jgi:hypothetical protein
MIPDRLVEYRRKIDALFRYAQNFAHKNEQAGKGTQWPTYRQAAKRMRCTYDELEQLIDDYDGCGYMGTGVGFQVGGTGGGVYYIKHRGDYVIEAYD